MIDFSGDSSVIDSMVNIVVRDDTQARTLASDGNQW